MCELDSELDYVWVEKLCQGDKELWILSSLFAEALNVTVRKWDWMASCGMLPYPGKWRMEEPRKRTRAG